MTTPARVRAWIAVRRGQLDFAGRLVAWLRMALFVFYPGVLVAIAWLAGGGDRIGLALFGGACILIIGSALVMEDLEVHRRELAWRPPPPSEDENLELDVVDPVHREAATYVDPPTIPEGPR